MVVSLLKLGFLKKRLNYFFFLNLSNKFYKLFYLLSYSTSLNLFLFFNSRLFFFFRIYHTFFITFCHDLLLRLKSKRFFFYFFIGYNLGCFTNMSKLKQRYAFTSIIHSFRPRNFFFTFSSKKYSTFISAGMGTHYRMNCLYRSVRHSNKNFVARIRRQFSYAWHYLHKNIALLYNKLSRRIMLSVKAYVILFKLINKSLRTPWLCLSSIVLKKKNIFGYMRGERKPHRRRKIRKRNLKYYY